VVLIQLPPTPIRTALDGLFPRIPPGLKYRLLLLWDRARSIDWPALVPLSEPERENVERLVESFMAHFCNKRHVRRPAAGNSVLWHDADAQQLAAEFRNWLPRAAAGFFVREIQSVLGRIDVPHLTRLTRAGAETLGVPPTLFWNPEAAPAPLEPRAWMPAWVRLELLLPGITRTLAACLLTLLLAGTVEAVEQRREETPFTALASVLLAGAWPFRMVENRLFYMVDLGRILPPLSAV
jgi:hypothetical protein